jgi:hypothetical protein
MVPSPDWGRASANGGRRLQIYLNDHLAGSTAGVELAKRVLFENQGTAFQATLEDIAQEVGEDREALLEVMRTLEVPTRPWKSAAAWPSNGSHG